MIALRNLIDKLDIAGHILDRCIGTNGVWADPERYRYQCWTRDFVLAVLPYLLTVFHNWRSLTQKRRIAKQHLTNLSQRQQQNGQIPILFLDKIMPFLLDKLNKSMRSRKCSFMLRRWLQGKLWNLTPGTRDSEVLYIIGMLEYANSTGDHTLIWQYEHVIRKSLDYIENNLLDPSGLMIGCDWRDTMERELGNKSLLTNNCLLYRAYCLLGQDDKATALKQRINQYFWNGTSYIDYPGSSRFDPLGASFAILHGVMPPEFTEGVMKGFRSVDSPLGVTIQCKHNPTSPDETRVIEETNGIVVWPFVIGFTILACLKIGQNDFAREQFDKYVNLGGFGFNEWYDPRSGLGYGSPEQLWSATLFLRAAEALRAADGEIIITAR